MKIKRVAIYDLDGTVIDSTHRYRTMPCGTRIDLQHWRDNEHLAMDDSLLPLAEQYKADLRDESCYVIVATARVLNEPDRQFIEKVLGQPDHIISRKADDTRSGAVLKVNGLQKFWNLKNFQRAAWVFYEDNVSYLKAVCDRFNIMGVYVPSKQGH